VDSWIGYLGLPAAGLVLILLVPLRLRYRRHIFRDAIVGILAGRTAYDPKRATYAFTRH
jgi:hypothetical protein